MGTERLGKWKKLLGKGEGLLEKGGVKIGKVVKKDLEVVRTEGEELGKREISWERGRIIEKER